jgi:hypothetical protein
MPGSSHPGVTTSSRWTCSLRGCCTLNEFQAAHSSRSDCVLIWELTVGTLEALVEVLKGWGVWRGGGGDG